jgi:hypothetical protein
LIIVSELDQDKTVIVLKITGDLQEEDWLAITPVIEEKISRFDRVSLFIDSMEFSGWQDLRAAKAHFNAVKLHHRQVQRVAVIARRQWQNWLTALANHFVDAEIKAFAEDERPLAENWLTKTQGLLPSLVVVERTAQHVLGIEIKDKIRVVDYEGILLPLLSQRIKEQGKFCLLVDMRHFAGMELKVFWDDLKFASQHFNDFKRMAIVGEQKWLTWFAKLASPFTKTDLRCFADQGPAWQWLESDD